MDLVKHADRIAQLVEQETFNLQVVGSIPTPVTPWTTATNIWWPFFYGCDPAAGKYGSSSASFSEPAATQVVLAG